VVKRVGEELWAVETPLRFLHVQLGRRVAVARLLAGEPFVHSPPELSTSPRDELGRVRHGSQRARCTVTYGAIPCRLPRRPAERGVQLRARPRLG